MYAKRQEKTRERSLRGKFNKEFELSEKIDTYSLSGRLTVDGRLIIAADVKSHHAVNNNDNKPAADETSCDQSLRVSDKERWST